MNLPDDLLYTQEHEWISMDESEATIGITDYAQQELGDVVYVELPEVGAALSAEEAFGSVESVKAVSEIYAPLAGEVIEVNEELNETPEVVNDDPYGEGWMIKLRIDDQSALDDLMSAEEYEAYLNDEQ